MVKDYPKRLFLFLIKFLARQELHKHRDATIIGITGSSGKSSCKDLVYAFLLPHFGDRLKYTKKGNSETGIPYEILNIPVKNYQLWEYPYVLTKGLLTVLFSHDQYDVFIIEYGIDGPEKPYNMEYLLDIVKPDIALFLSVSSVHGYRFEKLVDPKLTGVEKETAVIKAIAAEKVKLLAAVVDPKKAFITEQAASYLEPQEAKNFNLIGKTKDVSISKLQNTSQGCHIVCKVGTELYETTLPGIALPKNSAQNLLFATYVTLLLNLNLEKSFEQLPEHFHLEPGRSSLLQGINGITILDSSYNANPIAARDLFLIVDEIAKKEDRKRVIVLGELRELGTIAPEVHQSIVQEATKHADILILTNDIMRTYGTPAAEQAGFVRNEDLFWFENGKQLSYHIAELVPDESLVLFEGSQNTVFLEYAVKELLANKDYTYVQSVLPRMTPDWIRIKEKKL